jgi:hypothetical protein
MILALDPTYERPADQLGRGKWAAPPWLIVGIGAFTLVVVVLLVVLRIRSRLRARRVDDSPISSRRGSFPPPSKRPGA